MRLLGGQVYIRVQNMWQTRGVRGILPLEILILNLLLDAIWWNLDCFRANIIDHLLCH